MLKSVMAALAVTFLATPALAQWQPPRDMSIADPERQILDLVLDDVQRDIIRTYYASQPASYIPAARRKISPILVQRGNHVPHGVTKSDLPVSLEALLPALPAGVERLIIDNHVLLVDTNTNMILDGMTGVVSGR